MLSLSEDKRDKSGVASTLMLVLGSAPVSALAGLESIRSLLLSWLKARRFSRDDQFLFQTLDNGTAAKGLIRLLGEELDEFYEELWKSASNLSHFDTMVNFDNALSRPGEDAKWSDAFQNRTEDWLEDSGDDTSAQYYDKISEHLDLGELSRLEQFEQAAADAAAAEREPDDDEGDWGQLQSTQANTPAIDQEGRDIDALFASLADAPSREE
jgi:hypothetical protein